MEQANMNFKSKYLIAHFIFHDKKRQQKMGGVHLGSGVGGVLAVGVLDKAAHVVGAEPALGHRRRDQLGEKVVAVHAAPGHARARSRAPHQRRVLVAGKVQRQKGPCKQSADLMFQNPVS